MKNEIKSSFFGLVLALLILLSFGNPTNAQTINHNWAKNAGGNDGDDRTIDAVVDNVTNNLYVLGTFASQKITFGTTELTNKGQTDILLVKYAPTGNVLWAKSFGNTNEDIATAIAMGPDGSVVITGYYSSQSITLGSTTLNTKGARDIFVAKIDADGTVLWAKGAGGNKDDMANGITVDQNNSIYITGEYKSGSLSFGSKSVTKSIARSDVFVASYNSSGDDLWALTSAGKNAISSSTINDIIVDNQNRVVVGGRIGTEGDDSKYLAFSSDTIWAETNSRGWAKVTGFIARFQTNGTFIDGVADSVFYETICLANDENDNYYLGLTRQGSIFIGSPTGEFSILKMNSSLRKKWRKKFGSASGISKCWSVAAKGGNVFATGQYVGDQTNFETDTFFISPYRNRIYTNAFLVNYDTLGNEKWVQSYGGKITDEGKVVIPFKDSSLYLVGNHESDSVYLGNHLLMNSSDTGSYHVHVSPDWHWRHPNVFVTQIVYGTVSIDKPEPFKAVVYPNPSTGLIAVSSEQRIQGIEVFNSVGQLIHKMSGNNTDRVKVDLRNKPKGVYFTRVLTGDSYSLSKVIIH